MYIVIKNVCACTYACHGPLCCLPHAAADSTVRSVECHLPVREEHCLTAGMQHMQLHVLHVLPEEHLVGEKACVASGTGNSTVHTWHLQGQVSSIGTYYHNDLSGSVSRLAFNPFWHCILAYKLEKCHVVKWCSSGTCKHSDQGWRV